MHYLSINQQHHLKILPHFKLTHQTCAAFTKFQVCEKIELHNWYQLLQKFELIKIETLIQFSSVINKAII